MKTTSPWLLTLLGLLTLLQGCWSDATTCTTNADCFVGEQCINAVCTTPQSTMDMTTTDDGGADQSGDLSPTDMTADCTQITCEAGTFCNEDTGKCTAGCSDDTQCPETQTCDKAKNLCVCPQDTHLCGERCVSDFDVATCGDRCDPCPGASSGMAMCVQGMCSKSCGPNTLECQGQCADCPNDPAAVSFMCRDTSCVSDQCKDGFLQCAGTCAECPDIKGGEFGCDGAKCVVKGCQDGFKQCDQSCQECPEEGRPNGTTSCTRQDRCEFKCNDGFLLCGNACTQCPSGQNVLSFGCDASQSCTATSCVEGFVPCPQGCCRLQAPPSGKIPMTRAQLNAIAVDRQQRPVILYSEDNASAMISIAQWDGVSQWTKQTLTAGRVGGPESLAVDAQDKLHFVFLSADQKKVRYGTNTSGAFTYNDIVSVSDRDQTTMSLILDAQNTPHVAIASGGEVEYATLSANGWRVEQAYRSLGTKVAPSINFFQNNVRIAFRTAETTANVRYARRDNNGRWQSSRLTAQNQVHRAEHLSMLMVPNPVIIFDNELTKRIETLLFNANTQQWEFYTLSNAFTVNTDIAARGMGNAKINGARGSIELVYNNNISNQITLLTLFNNQISEATIGQPDPNTRPALAFDSQGKGHIVYIANQTGEVVYHLRN